MISPLFKERCVLCRVDCSCSRGDATFRISLENLLKAVDTLPEHLISFAQTWDWEANPQPSSTTLQLVSFPALVKASSDCVAGCGDALYEHGPILIGLVNSSLCDHLLAVWSLVEGNFSKSVVSAVQLDKYAPFKAFMPTDSNHIDQVWVCKQYLVIDT